MKLRAALNAAALVAVVGTGVARADDPALPQDESCTQPERGGRTGTGAASPAPNLAAPVPPEASSPLALPVAPEPQPIEPEPEPESTRGEPSDDPWPVEYVRQPQLAPTGWTRGSITSSTLFIDSGFRTPSGAPGFFGSTDFGARLSLGIPYRLELSIGVPRVLCVERGQPSACSSFNRWNGSGVSVALAALRSRPLQLKLASSVTVAYSDPVAYSLALFARAKWLAARFLALELEVGGNRWINPPPRFERTAAFAYWVDVQVDVQATRNLVLFLAGVPYGPIDELGDPRLQVSGGTSWTFENRTQLGALAGISNVLDRAPTDGTVPVRYVTLSLSFWL
jgi:hypothetical protein